MNNKIIFKLNTNKLNKLNIQIEGYINTIERNKIQMIQMMFKLNDQKEHIKYS